jgi:medium-chain acyl-[acyl-carrier-protein] hydrolase
MNTRERFEKTFNVTSYEIDFTGKMSVFGLFNRFQDLAGEHAEFLKVGYDLLRESNLAWILSRVKVKIFSLPKWEDKVLLATWPKGIDRLFALRDFSLVNEKGEVMALATSCWLLLDLDKKRPRKIDGLPINLTFPNAQHAINEVPDKISMPDDLITVFEKPIWLSDIDTNQHVNNAQYAKWISDCFTEAQYLNRRISSMQINFLEETKLGDKIELLTSSRDEMAGEYIIAGRNTSSSSIHFNSVVDWE